MEISDVSNPSSVSKLGESDSSYEHKLFDAYDVPFM